MKKEMFDSHEITYLSWDDIEKLCRILQREISKKGNAFDAIIAIQRGGIIPGVILSHLLKIPNLYTVYIRTTKNDGIKSERLDKPLIHIPDILKAKVKDKRILIVDDVTNTGNTLMYVKESILTFHPLICKSAVLVWDGDNQSSCHSDIFGLYTPSWVHFPWEL